MYWEHTIRSLVSELECFFNETGVYLMWILVSWPHFMLQTQYIRLRSSIKIMTMKVGNSRVSISMCKSVSTYDVDVHFNDIWAFSKIYLHMQVVSFFSVEVNVI